LRGAPHSACKNELSAISQKYRANARHAKPIADSQFPSERIIVWSNPFLQQIFLAANAKETTEARYYILSKYLSGKKFSEAVRNHWRIENSLHWQLDVTFGEDQSHIRKGHADENFSTLRRTAFSLLKREATAKFGIKNKGSSGILVADSVFGGVIFC